MPISFPYALTITNPGAETGNTTGWTNQDGTLITRTSDVGVTPRTGSYYFCSGSSGANNSAYQDIEIPSEVITYGVEGLIASFSVYHCTYSSGADVGRIVLSALDNTDSVLFTVETAPWNPLAVWTEETLDLYLPANTVKIRILLNGIRRNGTQNSCYWDDMSLELSDPAAKSLPYNLPVKNPGAETVGLENIPMGWISSVFSFYSTTVNAGTYPHDGSRFFMSRSSADMESWQDITLPESLWASVDNGDVVIVFSAWQAGYTDNDAGALKISGLDLSYSVIGTPVTSPYETEGVDAWRLKTLAYNLPQNTRVVRLHLLSQVAFGNGDIYWDDISATLYESVWIREPLVDKFDSGILSGVESIDNELILTGTGDPVEYSLSGTRGIPYLIADTSADIAWTATTPTGTTLTVDAQVQGTTAITDEAVGTGDGTTTVFYLDHWPANTPTITVNAVAETGFTLGDDRRTITFTTAPGDNHAILASYTAVDDPVALDWQAQTSGTALTVTLVADDYLWIRQTLTTTDDSVSPTLTEMLLEAVEATSTDTTNLLSGKVIIKSAASNLLDGLAAVLSSTANLLDGKAVLKSSGTNLFDGKGIILDDDTDLLDGKGIISSTATNLLDGYADIAFGAATSEQFDGKAVIKSSTTNLLDGKSIILSDATDLLDGAVYIIAKDTDLLDGKAIVLSKGTDLLDGAAIVLSSATDLLDGKSIIKSSTVDLLDGKGIISSINTDLLDGKVYVHFIDTDLLDGKTVILSDGTDLLDGKATLYVGSTGLLDSKIVISSKAINLLDGKGIILDDSTILLDGKGIITSSATLSLDGKATIRDAVSGLLDGKATVKNTTTNQLDGLIVIRDASTNLLDGTAIVKSSTDLVLDGRVTIKDVASDLLDGTITIQLTTAGVLDGKAVVRDAAVGLLDGTATIKDETTAVLDGTVFITLGTETHLLDGRVILRIPIVGKLTVTLELATPGATFSITQPTADISITRPGATFTIE